MNEGNVLVISPHPDDLEIGMAGTVLKLKESGFSVISVVVTQGRGSTNLMDVDVEELVRIRKKEVEFSSKQNSE